MALTWPAVEWWIAAGAICCCGMHVQARERGILQGPALPPTSRRPPPCPNPPSTLASLQEYLPPVLHATFLAAATEFVWLPWKAAQEAEAAADGASQGGSQAVRDGQRSTAAQADWLRQALPRQFTEKLLKQVGG